MLSAFGCHPKLSIDDKTNQYSKSQMNAKGNSNERTWVEEKGGVQLLEVAEVRFIIEDVPKPAFCMSSSIHI